ncbi:unnamed protein product [Schistosoma mattheei]|uniref:Uncharacterized protein n=1 Tax=Schistosoma mattheei TaxID=31246 RepID=A0A3P8A0P6_9TREM|nr:unnamed protein product [Schistosoma mattheei]
MKRWKHVLTSKKLDVGNLVNTNLEVCMHNAVLYHSLDYLDEHCRLSCLITFFK